MRNGGSGMPAGPGAVGAEPTAKLRRIAAAVPAGIALAAATVLALIALALALASPALGHAGERGFILLLPTGLFQAAGTMAVAVSFLVVIRFRAETLRSAVESARWRLFPVPRRIPGSNAVASVMLLGLIVAGLTGSRDPLANPPPALGVDAALGRADLRPCGLRRRVAAPQPVDGARAAGASGGPPDGPRAARWSGCRRRPERPKWSGWPRRSGCRR